MLLTLPLLGVVPGKGQAKAGPAATWHSSMLLPQAEAKETVSGRVTGENGEPLPGVTVLVKGTTIGTATNVDGSFALTVPDRNATLVFSYVGYVAQEVALNNRASVSVTLQPDNKALKEVVVVGYGTQNKSDVTGALSSVTEEQIQEVPVQNATQALQGRAAGVDIAQGTYRPGEMPSIRIRGNRSLLASNEPLYVVDGIPLAQGSSINDFNPQDIASIEILKDASSTAIYGARGANGVVLITTKRGRQGVTDVSYHGYVSFDSPLRKLDMFDGGEFAEFRREANRAIDGYSTLYPNPADDFKIFNQDPNMWESVAMGYEWVDLENKVPAMRPTTPEEKALYGVDEIPIYNGSNVRTTNWQDMALRTAVTQNHEVSISGGNEKVRVLFSGGYLDQEGIQLGQDYTRYNARLSLDYKVNNFITVGGSNNVSLSEQNYGVNMYGKAVDQIPIAVPYDADGNFILLPGGDINIVNPVLDPEAIVNERRTTRYFGSFYGELKFSDALKYRVNFGPDFRHRRTGVFQASESSERQGGTSYANNSQEQRFSYVLENLLFYDKKLKDHTIGLTLLQSIQNDRYESIGVSAIDLPYDSQLFYNIGSTNIGSPNGFGSNYSLVKLMSFMGRANYSFKDRYLVTLTGRYDGSSVLAPGNKWGFFPSVALGWKILEEPFMQNVSMFNQLKLRYSYGLTGNSAVGPYATTGTLGRTPYSWGDDAAFGYRPATIPTPGLGWEKTRQANLGLDFGILQGRIQGTVEVYRMNTTDLLMERAIPTASGFDNVWANVGATRNSGIEASLSTINVEAGNFAWSTDIVYFKNKEEITELYGGANDDVGNRWFIGKPVNVYYDYQFDGIWQDTPEDVEVLTRYRENGANTLQPGMIRVADTNGDNKFNADDYVYLGSTVPDWSGSINNTFSYKGLKLSVLVYARIGQMASANHYRATLASLSGRFPNLDVNYWTPQNPSNEYPQPRFNQEFPEYYSALMYQDASFVKIRNIALSYTLPTNLVSKVKAKTINLYFNAVNPFLFTDFNLLDPEGANGGDNLSAKSFVFGTRITL